MAQNGKGKEKFMGMLASMMQDRENRGMSASIELGTYHKSGIIPDSYPDHAEPDNDYYLFSFSPLEEGDRVLVLWTDNGDDESGMVVIGKLEGGDDDG